MEHLEHLPEGVLRKKRTETSSPLKYIGIGQQAVRPAPAAAYYYVEPKYVADVNDFRQAVYDAYNIQPQWQYHDFRWNQR